MKIAIAQIDPIVGAFESNVKKIKESYAQACASGARLLLTPELALCGYPPHDLIERPEMFEKSELALKEIAKLTQNQNCVLAVGHVSRNPKKFGKPAQNSLSLFEAGSEIFTQAKSLLPTYDVFDEARYFEPASSQAVYSIDQNPIAFSICEDLWAKDQFGGREIYSSDPVDAYEKAKAKLVVSLSSSPYEFGKRERREKIHSDVAARLKAPLVYVNQVGANDEILFDGASFAMNARGELLGRLPFFQNSFAVIDTQSGQWMSSDSAHREDQNIPELDILLRGLVVGIRDYFKRTGFKTAILGLSGGIDSAVVASLAVQALGAKNVMGIAMPSQFSSSHSLEDAEILAKNLGIPFEVRPIKFTFSTHHRELSEKRGALAEIAQENLQARLRGLNLMTLANHYNSLVLSTGNKSELAMGYCTLYGDMCGALAPLGDIYKTRVYDLAGLINQKWNSPIPNRSITKPPSAELKPNQTDQDTLPPYDQLDPVLLEYLESQKSVAEIAKKHGNWVPDILRKVEINEYKRRQAAPVLKITRKAFGSGRRVPIAKETWY